MISVFLEPRGNPVSLRFLGPAGVLAEVSSRSGNRSRIRLSWPLEKSELLQLEVSSLQDPLFPPEVGEGTIRITFRQAPLGNGSGSKVAQAEALFERGRAAAFAYRWKEALELYSRAQEKFVEAGDLEGQALVLNAAAAARFEIGLRREAILSYQQSLQIWKDLNDVSGRVETLNALGALYGATGEPDQSLQTYQEALRLAQETGDRSGEAETLVNLGGYWMTQARHSESLESLEQALRLSEELGDRRIQADALNIRAIVRENQGEPRQALQDYTEALRLRESIGDRVGAAQTLSNLGVLFRGQGESSKAIDHLERALEQRRKFANSLAVANTLYNLSVAQGDLGHWEKALRYGVESMELYRSAQGKRGEAFATQRLGDLYRTLGELKKAEALYRQCLPLWREVGDRRGEATTLRALGSLFLELNETEPARKRFLQSLELSRRIDNPRLLMEALSGLGHVEFLEGEFDSAARKFQESLELSRKIGDPRQQALHLGKSAEVHLHLNQVQAAQEEIETSLELARLSRDPLLESFTLSQRAELKRKQNDLEGALADLESVLHLVESVRWQVGVSDLRASFLASRQKYYQRSIQLLMQMHSRDSRAGFAGRAFEISERSRARSLLDVLQLAGTAGPGQGVTRLLREEERLRAEFNEWAVRFQRLSSRETDPEALAATKHALDQSAVRLQMKQAEIQQADPRYNLISFSQPLTIAEIQEKLLDEDSLFLEFASAEDHSYLWAVSSQDVDVVELASPGELENLARKFYRTLTERNRIIEPETTAEKRERLDRSAIEGERLRQILSSRLLGSLQNLAAKKTLIISAGGALQYVPFGALLDPGSGMLLAARKRMFLVPSATALYLLRRQSQNVSSGPHSVAAVADPVFDAQDPRVKSTSTASTKFESTDSSALRQLAPEWSWGPLTRLRFSRREAERITRLLPSSKSRLLLDFSAARKAVKQSDFGSDSVVHFATHAVLNDREPALSGIALSMVTPEGRPLDGFFRLPDIYSLRWNTSLVVLSACNTALGRRLEGEGMIGLVRGFFFAGVPAVVATLWSVDDRATARFMEYFYRALLGAGESVAEALRVAQNSMRRDSRWSDPYYWAGFVLWGDGEVFSDGPVSD